jgi:hypothetical protein
MPIGTGGQGGSSSSSNFDDSELRRRYQILQVDVPELDPTTALDLASSTVDDASMQDQAYKAISIGTIKNNIASLSSQPRETQLGLWNNMTNARKGLYTDNGYTAPDSSQNHDEWYNTLWKAPLQAVGWAWDHTPMPGVVGLVKSAADVVGNAADDIASRPYRAIQDMSGQQQDARVDLMLNDARQKLEQEGTSLTDDQWQYMKWKYEEDNQRTRVDVGQGKDEGRALFSQAIPGYGQFSDIVANLHVADGIPGLGDYFKDTALNLKTGNMYGNNSGNGALVNQSLYDKFTQKVDALKANKENDLSPIASWDRVDNGQSYVAPVTLKHVQEKLGGTDNEAFDVAAYLGQGHQIVDYVQNIENLQPGTQQFDDRIQKISEFATRPDFKNIVDTMTRDSSKVSIGRDFADILHIGRDNFAFDAVSGVFDAAHVMAMDPFLVAGKAAKIARVAAFGTDAFSWLGLKPFYAAQEGIDLGSEIVSGTDNIAKIANDTSHLAETPWIADAFKANGIDNIEPFIDGGGKPTDFLLNNREAISKSLSDAADTAAQMHGPFQADQLGQAELDAARSVVSTGTNAHAFYSGKEALDNLNSVVSRSSLYPTIDPQTGLRGMVQNRVMQQHFDWLNRIADAAKEANAATSEMEAQQAWVKLQGDLPHGNIIADEMAKLNNQLIENGGNGIESGLDVIDHFAGSGMAGIQSSAMSDLAIKGYGAGMKIPDSWRLFAANTEDIPVFRTRSELGMLPRVTVGNDVYRALATRTKGALDYLAQGAVNGGDNTLGKVAAYIANIPTKATGTLVRSIMTQAPTGEPLSLMGDKAVSAFKNLVDFGAFKGMSEAERDHWLGIFIGGERRMGDAAVRYSGLAGEASDVAAHIGSEAVDSGLAKNFVDKFGFDLKTLINSDGTATPTFLDNFEDVHKFMLDNAASDTASKFLNYGRYIPTNIDMGTRLAAERGFMDSLMNQMGFYGSEEGRAVAREWLGADQRYALDDLDKVGFGSAESRAPIFPTTQSSTQIRIPNTQALVALQRQMGMMRVLSMEKWIAQANRPMLNTLMDKYWRPFILLKPSFPLKVGSDEFVAFLARQGGYAPLASLATMATKDSRGAILGGLSGLVRSFAKNGDFYTSELADNFWRASKAASYEDSGAYMASVAKQLELNPNTYDRIALRADYITAKAATAIRRAEFRLLPENLKNAAVALAGPQGNAGMVEAAHLADLMRPGSYAMMRTAFHSDAIDEPMQEVFHTRMADEFETPRPDRTIPVARDFKRPQDSIQIKVDNKYEEMNIHDVLAREKAAIGDDDASHRIIAAYRAHELDPFNVNPTATLGGKILPEDADAIARMATDHPISRSVARDTEPLTGQTTRATQVAEGVRRRIVGTPESITDLPDAYRLYPPSDGWTEQAQQMARDAIRNNKDNDAFGNLERIAFRDTQYSLRDLPPAIRSHMEVVEPHSSYDQLVVNALNQKLFKKDSSMLEDLNVLTQAMDREPAMAHVLLGENPIRIANGVTDSEEMHNVFYENLMSEKYKEPVSGMIRSRRTSTGETILDPSIILGKQSLYNVMANEHVVNRLSQIIETEGQQGLLNHLVAVGLSEDDVPVVTQMLQNWNEQYLSEMIGGNRVTRNGVMVPLTQVSMKDVDQAQRITEVIDQFTKTPAFDSAAMGPLVPGLPPAPELSVTGLGHAAITDAEYKSLAAGANETANTVTIAHPSFMNKLDVYGDGATQRYNDLGMIDPAGPHMLEGVSREEVMHDWADILTKNTMGMFSSSKDGAYLHQFLEPMANGEFDMHSLNTVARDQLPEKIWAPVQFVVPKENVYERIVKWGWQDVVNPAMRAIVRNPMWTLGFADGIEGARTAFKYLEKPEIERAFASILSKVDFGVEDVRNLWHNIPAAARDGIDESTHFASEVASAAYQGKVDPVFLSQLDKLPPNDLKAMVDWARYDSNIGELHAQTASDRAMRSMIPYIHDHTVRSFFQDYARNLMPFEFAQEQFLKRWVDTVRYSPEGLRRLQLLSHAFSSSVLSTTDEQGNQTIAIPGTDALLSLLTHVPVVGDALFGGAAKIPISTPLTMKVIDILPNLTDGATSLPIVSPLVSIPAHALINHFPEFGKPLSPFLGSGPINPNQGILDQFVPQNYMKIYRVLSNDSNNSDVAATSVAALQQMESEAIRLRAQQDQFRQMGQPDKADGLDAKIRSLSLSDTASARDREIFLDNVKSWARANMLLRGVTGMMMPTTTHTAFKDQKLAPEFGALLTKMPFSEAVTTFLSEHADGQPFTVFATSKTSKAPMPPTEEALKWMDDHKTYLEQYPNAGPWLMPFSKTDSTYSAQARADMIAMGLRQRDPASTWYDNYKFAAGANVYFPEKQAFDMKMAEAADATERKTLQAQWDVWSGQYKNQHPLFADQLAKVGSSVPDETLRELKNALANPDLPDPGHITNLRTAVSEWSDFSMQSNLLKGDNSKQGRAARDELNTNFLKWGEQFVQENPEMRTVWYALLLPATNLRQTDTVKKLTGALA